MAKDSEATTGWEPERDLWEFVLALYAQDSVPPLCLQLQEDYELDVVLLLFAVWAGSERLRLSQVTLSALRRATDDWRSHMVLPLRAQRKQWRDSAVHTREYNAAKALEVEAERQQLQLQLSALSETPDSLIPAEPVDVKADSSQACVRENLLACLSLYSVDDAAAQSAIEVLFEAAAAI
ncbi:MAG: hypothetical protein Cons2KO_31140 [Congregibacter sp.]